MNSKNGSFVPCSIRPPSVDELTVSLLERDPRRYYQLLKEVSKSEDLDVGIKLREKLNETPYEMALESCSISFAVGGKVEQEGDRRIW